MAAAAAAAAESPGAAWQPRATPGAGAASASSSSLDDSRSSIDNDAAQAAAAALMASHTNPFVNDAGKPNSLAWVAVGLMAIAYADWACNCFAIPTMLPDISNSLGMGDVQGGLLTTGYTYMFAASMIPVGLLADRVNRFKLLGAGVAAWSGITFLSGSATSFAELISLRLGFAVAQAAQNPVSLSLVPDLFPQNKNAALAVYNSALYMGRALSYSAALAADRINDAGAAAGVVGATAEAGWREMLRFVALPGLAVAAALALMPEQRAAGGVATLEASAATASEDGDDAAEPFKVMSLLKSKAFVLTTLGASFTDMGYYALGAFQASFYERAYDLDPSMYAPTLSILLPIGGIVGGIGGGYIADKAAEWGLPRALTTAGSAGLASPFLLLSMLSPTATGSFVGLLFGLSLSEAWRAPAANMARSTAPAQYGSSTLSLYLCMRNVVGGLGPLGVAYLSQALGGDLQHAMVVIPAAYAMSGLMFFAADKAFDEPGAAKA